MLCFKILIRFSVRSGRLGLVFCIICFFLLLFGGRGLIIHALLVYYMWKSYMFLCLLFIYNTLSSG